MPGALACGDRLEGQPRGRSDILTLKEVSSLRKKFRRGESGIRSGMIGEPTVRPYGRNIHLIGNWDETSAKV
jgi:hypothetical protein